MADKLDVKEPARLLAFLQAHLRDWSRNTIKQRLQTGCVSVNGRAVTQHDHALKAGDVVEISASPKRRVAPSSALEILYIDRDLIAIHKPAGLLSVGTTKETQHHALALLRAQLAQRVHGLRLWPVHRIDRDTSGVLLFATSHEMREAVMAEWGASEKTYLAVVEGRPDPARGTIDQPLLLDEKGCRVFVGERPGAKDAVTHYQTEYTTGRRSLLRVQLETGRQHQIRAHLAWLGYPIVGDPRYGLAGPRMGLHALRLAIVHPNTGRELVFEAPVPADFLALVPMSAARKL